MKKIINIKTSSMSVSKIVIGKNLKKDIKKYIEEIKPTKTVYITDDTLIGCLNDYLPIKNGQVFILKNGEQEKSWQNLEKIIQFLLKNKVDKRSVIIGFGGGKVSDITGFAASVFYRGVPVIFIPTTLLAQVDASVGGKNTINFNGIKNVAGTIYQPKAAFIDIDNLRSLPKRQFASGMAENIKHGLGFDKNLFNLLKQDNINNHLVEIIEKSVKIKMQIVRKDQNESNGLRKLLNLGHTLGHALESEKELNLFHGEAVAIGLHFAGFIAKTEKQISQNEYLEIVELLKKYQLPINVTFNLENVLEKINYDKKKTGSKIDFIALKTIGECYLKPMSMETVKNYLIEFKKL